ncbi:hypothetical protein ACA910_019458 [Epithemia clementina (nom. ined.)]
MRARQVEGRFSLSASSLPQVPVARLAGHENDAPISVVCFTADGKYCLTGAHDRTVRLWNQSRLDPAYPPPKPKQQHGAQHHAKRTDSEELAEDLPRSLCIQTYHQGITHEVTALVVDEHCQTLVSSCDKALVVHDVVTGQCQRRLGGGAGGSHTGRINAVALGPHVETYLSASYDATVKIWDARNWRNNTDPIQTFGEAKDSVTDVHVDRISPNLIRTASVDGVVRTYDLRMGMVTCDDCHVAITSMVQSHDGQSLAVHGLDDATIRLLDLTNIKDTTMSRSGGDVDPSLMLLNTYTGHHTAGTYALRAAFTADDMFLVTGSEDGTAVIYHVVTAQPVVILEAHNQHHQQSPGQPRPTCAVDTSAATPTHHDSDADVKPKHIVITANYDSSAIVWAPSRDYMKWQD